MSDTVDVIWSGPFHSDLGPIGTVIQVTPEQAKANPGWFQPTSQPKLKLKDGQKPARVRKPRAKAVKPAEAEPEFPTAGAGVPDDAQTETETESES